MTITQMMFSLMCFATICKLKMRPWSMQEAKLHDRRYIFFSESMNNVRADAPVLMSPNNAGWDQNFSDFWAPPPQASRTFCPMTCWSKSDGCSDPFRNAQFWRMIICGGSQVRIQQEPLRCIEYSTSPRCSLRWLQGVKELQAEVAYRCV